MEKLWKKSKSELKDHIPEHSFRMWIEPIEFSRCGKDSLVLVCPNHFSKKRILDQYAPLIEDTIQQIFGKACTVSFEVCSQSSLSSTHKANEIRQLSLPNMNPRPYGGRFLRQDYTFDQFVVGGNNDFAYSAALSLASRKNSGQGSLFLLSKTGMGKSHLAQAVGHHILSEFPAERVFYVTAEDFTNQMIHALQHSTIDKFKENYRQQCDVLLMEDIHFLSGKERTQTELSLTIESLLDSNKKIIFSSCYLPVDIPKLSEKLQSCMSCGLITNIDPPNYRTRVRILEKKTMTNGYVVPEEVIHYLATELTENVRQLNSGLIGVTAKSSLLGTSIDLNLAESVVRNIVRQSKRITMDVIKNLVCKHYRISNEDIMSPSRKQSIVRPRQIAMFLARKYTDHPLQAIGKSFNRYHATALHAIKLVTRELKENTSTNQQIAFLCQKLESGKF